MNSIASSVALRCHLGSIVLRRKSLHLWPHKNHSLVCVRLASTKTKSGLLTRLKNIFNRTSDERTSMSPRIRSVMDLAPRGSQPPIREPNMPEKRDRKDDKKEQKDKKPVLKTLSNQEPPYKYQWGVRVPDDNPEPRDVEKSLNYVVAHKWGVNVSKYNEPEETVAIKNTAIASQSNIQTAVETNITNVQVAESISQAIKSEIPNLQSSASTLQSAETRITRAQSEEPSSQVIQSGTKHLSSIAKTVESPQTSSLIVPTNEQETAPQNPKSGVDLTSGTIISGDDDYNIPKEIPQGSEISAWRDVVIRSKLREEELARRASTELSVDFVESIFIRPEPPQPKLDVQIVGSASDVASSEQNVAKSLTAGSNTPGMNFSATKKFHTCTIACRRLPSACHRNMMTNLLSTTSRDGKDFQSFPPNSEDSSRTETNERGPVQAQQEFSGGPKLEEDLSSVLQDLSQREMEVLLSYKQHSSDEIRSCPILPTSVTISTFPPSSNKNASEYMQQNGNEIFNAEDSNANAEITELEQTILKLKESDDKDDGKEIKDKKSNKDGDYIRIPGDPYPYSREHYEKWRVPHGKCPIVNDDVPKAKPAETSDSPR